jgi:hypothetical protein
MFGNDPRIRLMCWLDKRKPVDQQLIQSIPDLKKNAFSRLLSAMG